MSEDTKDTPPQESSQRGVVSAGNEYTARAGAAILRQGGNAVDAAVAATCAAFVAEPPLTSPFGGGFAVVSTAESDAKAYNFFANEPGLGLDRKSATKTIDFHPVDVSFGPAVQIFHVGRGSTAFSLLLKGLYTLNKEHGKLPLHVVVEPAAKLAEKGVPTSETIAPIYDILGPIITLSPEAKELFSPGGRLLQTGELFRSPQLAALLRDFGAGNIDAGMDEFLEAFGPPHGLNTREDLQAAEVAQSSPLQVQIGECSVIMPPLPAAGGTLIAFSLKLLEKAPPSIWADEYKTYAHLGAAMAATQVARVDLDAATRHSHNPNDAAMEFLSDAHVEKWMPLFNRLTKEGITLPLPEPPPDLGSTTHISCIDADGMACAITSSNGEGSGHMVPGTGVMSNNFLGEGDLHPHGFQTGTSGQKITSMMCPTIVSKGGMPIAAIGTGGSSRIRTALVQVLARRFFGKESFSQSVNAPRLHFDEGKTYIETKGIDRAMKAETISRLHDFAGDLAKFDTPHLFFGGVHIAAAAGESTGDARRGGKVVEE